MYVFGVHSCVHFFIGSACGVDNASGNENSYLQYLPTPRSCVCAFWTYNLDLSCSDWMLCVCSTFSGTELPPIEEYVPGCICQKGGSCYKLSKWLHERSLCSWQGKNSSDLPKETAPSCPTSVGIKNEEGDNQVMDMASVEAGGRVIGARADFSGVGRVMEVGKGVASDRVRGTEEGGDDEDVNFIWDALRQSEAELTFLPEVQQANGLSTMAGVGRDRQHHPMEVLSTEASRSQRLANVIGGGGERAEVVNVTTEGGGPLMSENSIDMESMMQMMANDALLSQQEGKVSPLDAALVYGEEPTQELYVANLLI
ncbi:unnamed protein product [Choristocarpus tenellus]